MQNRLFSSLYRLLIFITLPSTYLYSASPLDTTFGQPGSGYVTTPLGVSFQINSIAIQSDGNIVGVGSIYNSNTQGAIVRYTTDGALDSSFGTGGVVTTNIGSSSSTTSFSSVVLQPDGSIVAAGYNFDGGAALAVIARYTATGALDTSFNTTGIVTFLLGDASSANSVALQADGSIIIAGVTSLSGTPSGFLARFTSSGSLDTTFGGTGSVSLLTGVTTVFNAVTVDASGNIVATGYSSTGFTTQYIIARYTSIGAPDTTFGTTGLVIGSISNNSRADALVIDTSGNILIAGSANDGMNNQFLIARYNSLGVLDSTFGSSGIVMQLVGSGSFIESIALQPDGNIAVGGFAEFDNDEAVVARYDTTGALDTTFGTGGIVTLSIGAGAAFYSIAIQPSDGRIVAGGYETDPSTDYALGLLARFNLNNTDFISITSIAAGSTINTSIPVISGTSSAASAQVNVYLNGTFFTTVSTDGSGNWNAGTSTVLGSGLNNIRVDLIVDSTILVSQEIIFTVNNSFAFGNLVRVDKVYGSDATGQRNGSAFSTINAALAVAHPGDTVWLFPGTYTESFTIPNGVSIAGAGSVIITKSVSTATDLVTMGENSHLLNVILSLTSSSHVQLRGIVFPGTTSATAKIQSVFLTVDNSTASTGGSSNVYGIHSTGAGTPTPEVVAMRTASVTVNSIGGGNKRGLLVDASNNFHVRDANFVVKQAGGVGSYIGVETNNGLAVTTLHTSTISGATADISQTLGSLTITASDLLNANANSLGFNTTISPSALVWGGSGTVPTATSFFYPGAAPASATEIFLRAAQPMVVGSLSIRAGVAPGGSNVALVTLRKNGTNTPLTVSLTGTQTTNTANNVSVSFAAGDDISLQCSTTGGSTTDAMVTMEMY